MKDAVLEALGETVCKDIPVPDQDPDGVLIKISCCGIWGTDAKLCGGTVLLPLTAGEPSVTV